MRDPWGVTKWKGQWNNKDKIWNQIKQTDRLNKKRARSGSFFICYEDFLNAFGSIKICYCHDDYIYSALKISNSTKDEIIAIQVEIPSKAEYYFSFLQVNARCYKNLDDYKYSNISMYMFREYQSGRVEYVKGVFKDFKEGWIKHNCVKGKYWLILIPHWRSFVKQFAFSVYGPKKCSVHMVG